MLVLVDGSSVLYRAYYAIRGLSTKAGVPTNAVYGFITILNKIIKDFHPDAVAVAFDVSKKTFRTELYPDYKAHRPPMPDDLASQIPKIKEYLDLAGIPRLEYPNYEADDVIATLARTHSGHEEVLILSGDKDMIPLVTDRISLYQPSKEVRLTPDKVREMLEINPAQMTDILSLMGDASDNIPGVKGIGEKGAFKLVKEWGTLEDIFAHIDAIKPDSLKNKLVAGKADALLSKNLVILKDDLPLDTQMKPFSDEPPSPELNEWFHALEFHSLARSEQKQTPRVEVVREIPDMPSLLWTKDGILHQHKASVAAISPSELAGLPHDETTVTFQAKPIYKALLDAGLDPSHLYQDAEIAAWLLDSGLGDYPLDVLFSTHLGRTAPEDPVEICRALPLLWSVLEEKLKAQGLEKVYETIEKPLTPVLAAMERNGIALDASVLHTLSRDADRQLLALQEKIYDLAGGAFNIASPKQLREILFVKMGLTASGKKTAITKQLSTGEDSLLELAAQGHDIATLVLKFRELAKLKGTYLDPLPALADSGGRLHTTFRQTGAATGRLSSVNPNLQNIPVRSEMGAEVRKAFAAPPGRSLVVADYSQIELRLLAHFSGDDLLKAAFADGRDIHRETAARIFQLPPGDVTPQMRRSAKTIVFGLIYGMSVFGLSQALNVPREDAKIFMEAYFRQFPKVKAFMDGILEQARSDLKVTTLSGRVRLLPELKSRNFNVRANAERMAINAPLQGSAADIIKMAMIRVWNEGRSLHSEAALLLQVHDELLLEAPADGAEALCPWMEKIMASVVKLSVPLTAHVAAAINWFEAK